MNRQHTVYLNTSPLTNGNAIRGVGTYTRWLLESLRQLNQSDFSIISAQDPGYQQFVGTSSDIIHYPFFDLFFHTLPIRCTLPIVAPLLRKLKVLGQSDAKVIVTIHDVIPLLYPDHYPVGVRGRVHHLLQKIALSRVDAVITDSEASKLDIHRLLSVPLDKIHVVYLAANPLIQPVVSDQRVQSLLAPLNLPHHYMLYVGDINYNKNIPNLIRSLTFIDESVHLVCVGKNFVDAPIPEWDAITAVMSELKLSDRVHFITDLASDQTETLSALYAGAVCYVQPSLAEGFGLPVLEALQVGVPVVATHNSSLIEVGGDAVEFCEPSPKSIGEAVRRMLGLSVHEKRQRITHGQQWAKEFSWQHTAEETLAVYDKVLQR